MFCQGIKNKRNPRNKVRHRSEFYELILPTIPNIDLGVIFQRICAKGHSHIAADTISIVRL